MFFTFITSVTYQLDQQYCNYFVNYKSKWWIFFRFISANRNIFIYVRITRIHLDDVRFFRMHFRPCIFICNSVQKSRWKLKQKQQVGINLTFGKYFFLQKYVRGLCFLNSVVHQYYMKYYFFFYISFRSLLVVIISFAKHEARNNDFYLPPHLLLKGF